MQTFKKFLIENERTKANHKKIALSKLSVNSKGEPMYDASHDEHAHKIVDISNPEKVVDHVNGFDPTPTGEYTPHMVRFLQHPNPTLRPRLEDLPSMHDDFKKYKHLIDTKAIPREKRKIKQVDSYNELKTLVGHTVEKVSSEDVNHPDVEKVYSDKKGLKIYHLKTADAAHDLYKNTSLCIAKYHPSDNRNMFNQYAKNGKIYSMHHPDGEVSFFDHSSSQFMNSLDVQRPAPFIKKLIEEHPDLKGFSDFHQHMISAMPDTIEDVIRGEPPYFRKK